MAITDVWFALVPKILFLLTAGNILSQITYKLWREPSNTLIIKLFSNYYMSIVMTGQLMPR
jgi:hypothetical protein